MNCPPEQYANRPNLWRVAQELATFKEPCKVLNMALAMAGPMLEREKEAHHEQQ